MPKGYSLNPGARMKIEDERAGRLDYTYRSSLSVSECLKRIGYPAGGRISEYKTETRDGVLYFLFDDPPEGRVGLHVSMPLRYAVRFESDSDKTLIRVRYIWDIDRANVPYYPREDIDSFFTSLFHAQVIDNDKKIWTDSAEGFVRRDPLGLHGSRFFWAVCAIFVILWLICMFMFVK